MKTLKTLQNAKIERETEKALFLKVDAQTALKGRSEIKVWFPKSQLEIEGDEFKAPAWLIEAKNRDAVDGFRGYGSWVSIQTV